MIYTLAARLGNYRINKDVFGKIFSPNTLENVFNAVDSLADGGWVYRADTGLT